MMIVTKSTKVDLNLTQDAVNQYQEHHLGLLTNSDKNQKKTKIIPGSLHRDKGTHNKMNKMIQICNQMLTVINQAL